MSDLIPRPLRLHNTEYLCSIIDDKEALFIIHYPSERERQRAAYIVKAVNCHDALAKALEECEFALGRLGANALEESDRPEKSQKRKAWENARAAIAAAKGA